MPKQSRQAKKNISGKSRLNDAKRWLSNHPQKSLISAYSKRYGVDIDIAEDELIQLSFYDEISIQHYEEEGIEWEYKVEPTTGDMVVVPKDTEDHEIYEIHGMF